jgi:hypothetical protein
MCITTFVIDNTIRQFVQHILCRAVNTLSTRHSAYSRPYFRDAELMPHKTHQQRRTCGIKSTYHLFATRWPSQHHTPTPCHLLIIPSPIIQKFSSIPFKGQHGGAEKPIGDFFTRRACCRKNIHIF